MSSTGEIIVNKELSSGSLLKLQNGNLVLGPADYDEDSSDNFKFEYHAHFNTMMTSPVNSSYKSSPQRMRGGSKKCDGIPSNGANMTASPNAISERRQIAKKVFDSSDYNVTSKRKRGSQVGSLNKSTIKKRLMITGHYKSDDKRTALSEIQLSPDGSEEPISHETSGVCSLCLVQRPRGSNDKLVECRDCDGKAHLSCLQSSSCILKPRSDNTWQCQHCKTCIVCCETNYSGILTVCNICYDAYHASCHSPHIPERLKARDEWECKNCLISRPTIECSPAIIYRKVDYSESIFKTT